MCYKGSICLQIKNTKGLQQNNIVYSPTSCQAKHCEPEIFKTPSPGAPFYSLPFILWLTKHSGLHT
jgi:hypothetical protein